jgi:hypothetical protein
MVYYNQHWSFPINVFDPVLEPDPAFTPIAVLFEVLPELRIELVPCIMDPSFRHKTR